MTPEHLDNDALLRASYGTAEPRELEHAAACAACGAAVSAIDAHRRRRTAAGALDDLPEAFWQRQRQAIVARVEQPAAPPFRRAVAAFSLATLLALALLLVARPAPPLPPAAPPHTAADDRFLLDIYATLNRNEVRALSPIALLLQGADSQKEVNRK